MTAQKLHLCFDFDETITKEHKFDEDPYGADEIRHPGYLQRIMMKAIDDGHLVSITTCRAGEDDLIKTALVAIGLPDEYIKQIPITANLSDFEGKNHHIKNALKKHPKPPHMRDSDYLSVLIDDSPNNIEWAKQAGHGAIEVTGDPGLAPNVKKYDDAHLVQLEAILNEPDRYITEHEARAKNRLG